MNLLTAAKAALEALETCDWNDNDFPDDTQYFDRFAVSEAATKLRAAIEEAEKQEPEHCMCPACINGNLHASDCAVHNAPALPIGECDCGLLNPAAPTVPEGMMLVKRSDLAAACGMAGWNAYDRRCYLLLEKMLAAPNTENKS